MIELSRFHNLLGSLNLQLFYNIEPFFPFFSHSNVHSQQFMQFQSESFSEDLHSVVPFYYWCWYKSRTQTGFKMATAVSNPVYLFSPDERLLHCFNLKQLLKGFFFFFSFAFDDLFTKYSLPSYRNGSLWYFLLQKI